MRNSSKKIFHLFLSFAFMFLFHLNHAEACEVSANKRLLIEKDATGRIIILWVDSKDKSLKVSIDQDHPKAISLPGQKCYDILCETTPEGDVIALWSAVDEFQEHYALYAATLPSGKKWNQPVRLTNDDEYIVSKSYIIKAHSQDDIQIFWQSFALFESEDKPNILQEKIELRNISATIKSWGQPKTLLSLKN
jgi:hypothetical protein